MGYFKGMSGETGKKPVLWRLGMDFAVLTNEGFGGSILRVIEKEGVFAGGVM